MNNCVRATGSSPFGLATLVAVLGSLLTCGDVAWAEIPLKRVILEGKVVAGPQEIPVNRVWVGVYARGEDPVAWDWTRSDGTFRCNLPIIPGKYRIELRPVNHIFEDFSTEIHLPELAPGETEETLLTAGRFMSARGILEQPVNRVIVDRVAQKTGQDRETVTEVMTALIDAVNEFYFEEFVTLSIPMVKEAPLRTVTIEGSVRGLLGRGRLRGGIAKFLWQGYEIDTVSTDSDHRFRLESVQVPVGELTVIAGDRFGLFQRVEKDFMVTPETTVVRLDDLACGLRGWVKATFWLVVGIVLWIAIRGGRRVPQTTGQQETQPPLTQTTVESPATYIDDWRRRFQPLFSRARNLVRQAWTAESETRESVKLSAWFWVHGGLLLIVVISVVLQLYGYTIRASGPLSRAEASAVLSAQQLRDASLFADRDLYKEGLQVHPDFTPFQALVWSLILSVAPFRQAAWQIAHLLLLGASALFIYLAAWALSQRILRVRTEGSVAGMCAAILFLLCPAGLRYSCTLYPEIPALFLASASAATWCLVGVTPPRPTLVACSLLLGLTFLVHPMHGLVITILLAVATAVRRSITSQTAYDLCFLVLPGAIAVTVFSRIFLPDTSRLMYAFLARGESLGPLSGLQWCLERLLADYAPYRPAMAAVLFTSVLTVWLFPDRRIRGLGCGMIAGILFAAFNTGKYWSSLLGLIPAIVLLPALAVEAIVAHLERPRQKAYALAFATFVLFLAPFMQPGLYQKAYYGTRAEWNTVLDRLLPSVNIKRGALIIGESGQLPPEAVNVALVERYEANPEIIYRPSFQGKVTVGGDRIVNPTQTYEEIARWLRHDLVGSVNTIELLPGHPLLEDATFMDREGWCQTWVEIMKLQPWYPETATTTLDELKISLHVYSRPVDPCRIGRSRRLDGDRAGIIQLNMADEGGRYVTRLGRNTPMHVQAKLVNLQERPLSGTLWWIICRRFTKRPWERARTETRQPVMLQPLEQKEFGTTLSMPGDPGKYWLVVYLHAEDGTHLDAAFLEDDIEIE